MKVTVCELPDNVGEYATAWQALRTHVTEKQSDLVLLPEMPAHPWFADLPEFDHAVWRQAIHDHDELIADLAALPSAMVLGSRPTVEGDRRLNQGFYWTTIEGYRRVHEKYYLPDFEGFYELRWFHRKERDFTPVTVSGITLGFLICTDVMFNEWARHYGRQGAHLIAVPRATLAGPALDRWLVVMRMAAIVSGSFVLSSNRVGQGGRSGKITFGGSGWIISPNGDVLASTSRNEPFATLDIDLAIAESAKMLYPRNVSE